MDLYTKAAPHDYRGGSAPEDLPRRSALVGWNGAELSHPCKRLKALDKRYRTRYHMSMLENLAFLQANGLEEFVRQQDEKYRCARCGKLRTVHQEYCIHCATLEKANRKRKQAQRSRK